MPRALLTACLCALLILAPAGAFALEPASVPTVTVMGRATLDLAPQLVVLTFGVETTALTAAQAASANAALSQKVKQSLDKLKTPEDRLETVGYNLGVHKEWDNKNRRNVFKGYRVDHTLRLTIGAAADAGRFIDAAVAAGATDVNGPNWALADPHAAELRVLRAALADGRDRAQALAEEAGMVLGTLLAADAAPDSAAPGPRPRYAMARAENDAATSLEPGMVGLSANVLCTYSLAPRGR